MQISSLVSGGHYACRFRAVARLRSALASGVHTGQSGRLSLPARLCSDDIVLRPWDEADRDSIGAIVRASRQEFDDWLPMLASALDDFDAYMRTVALDADRGVGWTYAVEVDDAVVGQCTAELRDDNTVEIGYWVRTDRVGEGIATRAVRILSVCAANRFANVIIRCDAGNVRSTAVASGAGFVHGSSVDLDPTIKGTSVQTGREMTWRLTAAP